MAPNTAFDLKQQQSGPEEDTVSAATSNDVVQLSFSHVNIYVDHVEDLDVYKELERNLKTNNNKITNDESSSATFCSQNRDMVKQLLAGFGFCVTGVRMFSEGGNTRSVLITSKDPHGVQFVVTAVDPNSTVETDLDYPHFDASTCPCRCVHCIV